MATSQDNQPLTPEQRRALARAPLPTFYVYGGHSWGGRSTEMRIFHATPGGRDTDNHQDSYEQPEQD